MVDSIYEELQSNPAWAATWLKAEDCNKCTPDGWRNSYGYDPKITLKMVQPLQQQAYAAGCARTGALCSGVERKYVENPVTNPRISPCDSSFATCATVALDGVSFAASVGAAGAQTIAVGCGVTGVLPCAAAAEGTAGALATVSTVASVVGTGITAVQVVRGKAPPVDLAVSATSTLLGVKAGAYAANAGASKDMADLAGAYLGVGGGYFQYKYDAR